MRLVATFIVAMLLLAGFSQPAQAQKPLNGYVSTQGAYQFGIEPAGLMIDPNVERYDHEQAKKARAQAHRRSRFTIAIVPHDYKDEYNVGVFDSRRGDAECSMKGVYARCYYKQNENY